MLLPAPTTMRARGKAWIIVTERRSRILASDRNWCMPKGIWVADVIFSRIGMVRC